MGSMKPLTYPLIPKSTSQLVPGQFWAIPLADGSYGCGRVIDLHPPGATGTGMRSMFLAGVLDWHSRKLPTANSIAGKKCLDQGKAHLVTILRSGGCLLGQRDLELDGIEPWIFKNAEYHPNSWVSRGLQLLRRQTKADYQLPLLEGWGYGVPQVVAEMKFLTNPKRTTKPKRTAKPKRQATKKRAT